MHHFYNLLHGSVVLSWKQKTKLKFSSEAGEYCGRNNLLIWGSEEAFIFIFLGFISFQPQDSVIVTM